MRSATLILVTLLLVSLVSTASSDASLLIVDQTVSLMESMQVEILARALLGSGLFSIKAVTEIPDAPHPAGSFDFVVVIPPSREWVWVCAPGLPEALPVQSQQALSVLESAIEEVFMGARQAANPSEDLFSLLLSAYFLSTGVMEEAD